MKIKTLGLTAAAFALAATPAAADPLTIAGAVVTALAITDTTIATIATIAIGIGVAAAELTGLHTRAASVSLWKRPK